ncbi:MAG: YncE family protein [Chloroflexia bacterium]
MPDAPDQLAQLREEIARLAAAQAATATRLAQTERELARFRARRGTRRGTRWLAPLLIAALVALVPLGLTAANFQDLNQGSPHNNNINAIADAGISRGCTDLQHYCPNNLVTREEMASFLARTAGLGTNPPVTNAATALVANNVIDGAITTPKLSSAGSTAGQVLVSTGTGVAWQAVPPGEQGPPGQTGPQGPPGIGLNTLDIALLRWYAARGSTGDYPAFAVGTHPSALAFDGSHMWVTTRQRHRLQAAHRRRCQPRQSSLVGGNPIGVAFDGATIWVASQGQNLTTIARLRASDGQSIGTALSLANQERHRLRRHQYLGRDQHRPERRDLEDPGKQRHQPGELRRGRQPVALAFDGTNIWIANKDGGSVTKLRASDGFNLGTINVGTNPGGLAFDGANIWVSVGGTNSVVKLRASDGTNLGSFTVGNTPGAVAFDGQHIWVANTAGNSVTKLKASDGTNLGTFTVGTHPSALAFDGSNVWVANRDSNSVSKR